MISNLSIVIRLVLAVILGGLIGIERERRNQPAGLRTHIILCVGSTLIMLVSIYLPKHYANGLQQSDPGRIAAQVVSGVGFLGAGAILRLGVSIKGLTTAASLWTTAGIGLAVGCGFYLAAIFATLLIGITLSRLSKWEKVFLSNKTDRSLNITAVDTPELLGKIEHILISHNIYIKTIQLSRSTVRGIIEINTIVFKQGNIDTTKLIKELTSIGDITEVEVI